MLFPIKGQYKLTQGFGENPDWYKPLKGHMGYDFASGEGTPIICPHEVSVVVEATFQKDNWGQGYGNAVRLLTKQDSGEWLLDLFAHLLNHNPGIKEGDVIGQGRVIGLVDSTGRSTGNHLHWEEKIYINDDPKYQGQRNIFLGKSYFLPQWNNGYNGSFDFLKENKPPKDVLLVDERYNQRQSFLKETTWKITNEKYAKKKCQEATIPYDDRIMKACVYGYWDIEFVCNVANYAVWTIMHKPEYLKRIGKIP